MSHYNNAELISTSSLNNETDICMVLSSQNKEVLKKIFHHNDLGSHMQFMKEIMEYLYSEDSVVTMYALCNNASDLKAKFSVFWFFEYMLTAVEINSELEMCLIHNNKVVKIDSDTPDFEDEQINIMLSKIRSNKFIGNPNQLSKSIYNQDHTSLRWIDSL